MISISVTAAKAQLSELIRKAEDGEIVIITRWRKPVVRLVSARKPLRKVDAAMLRKVTEGFPLQKQSAGEFIREMRDSDRY
jgi:prevent-host-death family protein